MDKKVLIGADPELFAVEDTSTGTLMSVHDKIPGSKMNPVRVPNGAIQVDGVAAEFNIDPAETEDVFYHNISSVSSFMERFLQGRFPKSKLVATPTAFFTKDYFNSLPDRAKELGCEPDFDAYTGKPNPKPSTNLPMRTGSGHLHIGFHDTLNPIEPEHFEMCRNLVKELDKTLYPVSMLWDSDTDRRTLYGAPGSFRPKSYGVEYRVLSNAWVGLEWATRYVFSLTKAVTERFLSHQLASEDLAHLGPPSNSVGELLASFEILDLPLPPASVIAAAESI